MKCMETFENLDNNKKWIEFESFVNYLKKEGLTFKLHHYEVKGIWFCDVTWEWV